MTEKRNVKYPCRGCVYFNSCGNSLRTQVCKGRVTQRELDKACKPYMKDWKLYIPDETVKWNMLFNNNRPKPVLNPF